MSTSGEILFLVCGLIALVSAVLTITNRTPLRAAIALLVHVVSLAGLYLSLHAHLLAAIQLIVYAGAVVVLFVFVIMLMGPGAMGSVPGHESRAPGDAHRGWVVKAFGAGMIVLVVGAIAFSIGEATATTIDIPGCPDGDAECGQFGGVNALSHEIYRNGAVPFELLSILLLVAIVSAIAVARGRTADEKKTIDDLESIKLSPRPFPKDAVGPSLSPGAISTPEGTIREAAAGEHVLDDEAAE